MKILNDSQIAPTAGQSNANPRPVRTLTIVAGRSARLAATAAGAAVAGSTVGLAFFLSRKPTPSTGHPHAKFRA